MLLELLFIFFK